MTKAFSFASRSSGKAKIHGLSSRCQDGCECLYNARLFGAGEDDPRAGNRAFDEVIAKNNIPFPKSIPRTRPIINFTAELLSTTHTSSAFNHNLRCKKQRRRQGWQRIVPRKILYLLARTRVSHVGRRVLESARSGPVAIVGEGIAAFALARFLSCGGRDSVILSCRLWRWDRHFSGLPPAPRRRFVYWLDFAGS
jgi:hypothetical protein